MHSRLSALYHGKACTCPGCSGELVQLSAGDDKSTPVMTAAESAYNHLHAKGSYHPRDLGKEAPYKELIDATVNAFNPAIEDNKVPEEMTRYLQKDVHLFSGLKTHAQLLEASKMLTDKDGNKRPFNEFANDVAKLNEKYNRSYLEAEYLFANTSAQMAAKWAGFADGAGRYNLQYRTAKDDRVRASHRILDETTLPYDNPFWDSYYPPNGWRCRCTVIEVRKGKYEESDSAEAIKSGEKATTELDKNGKNTLEIFRFNPGKEQKVFPPDNPYTKVAGAGSATTVINHTE